jgi:hypothetical protein
VKNKIVVISARDHQFDAMAVPGKCVHHKAALMNASESMGWAVSDITTKATIKSLCRDNIIHKVKFLSEEILKPQGKVARIIRKALNYSNDSGWDGFWASTCLPAVRESIRSKQNSMITNMEKDMKKGNMKQYEIINTIDC